MFSVSGCHPVLVSFDNNKDKEEVVACAVARPATRVTVTEDFSRQVRLVWHHYLVRKFPTSIKKKKEIIFAF